VTSVLVSRPETGESLPLGESVAAPPLPISQGRVTRLRVAGPLVLILLVQALLSLKQHHFASEDEALYLYAGHLELVRLFTGATFHAYPLTAYSSYFSGDPYLYPPLAAVVAAVGGLEGARALSLVFMLSSTVLVCGFTRRMFGDLAGVLAAALFVASSPTLFLGNVAVYDPMAIFLLAVSARLAVTSPDRTGWAAARMPALAGVAAALCGFTGYAGLLFIPSVGLVTLLASPRSEASAPAGETDLRAGTSRRRDRLALQRSLGSPAAVRLLSFILGAAAVSVTILLLIPALIQGMRASSIGWTVNASTSPLTSVIAETLWYIGPALVLSALGFAVLVAGRSPWRVVLLSGVLLVSGLLASLYAVHLHTEASLYELDGFSLVFAAALAGAAGSRLFRWWRGRAVLPVIAGLLVVLSFAGATFLANFNWKSESAFVKALSSDVQRGKGHYLVQQAIIPQYYLASKTEPAQWVSTYSFRYTTKAGVEFTGASAYQIAIEQSYFSVIALQTDGKTQPLDAAIKGVLLGNPQYQPVKGVRSTASQVGWQIWKLEPVSLTASAHVHSRGR
jgi:hypothetical protein